MNKTTIIREIKREAKIAVTLNNGKRAEIKDVPGLDECMDNAESRLPNHWVTQVKFKTRLTKKHLKYIRNAVGCGSFINICGIARVMNYLNCGFQKAAETYFRNGEDLLNIVKG